MSTNSPKDLEVIDDRSTWKVGSHVFVRCRSDGKWYDGQVKQITYSDDNNRSLENEWLSIQYNKHKKKKVQRDCKDIRPIPTNDARRNETLSVGSECLIRSTFTFHMIKGQVVDISIDDEGEWLKISYVENDNVRLTEIQRYSPDLEVFMEQIEEKQDQIESTKLTKYEAKQIESYSHWDCDECKNSNILYHDICEKCKKNENSDKKIESNVREIIKILIKPWGSLKKMSHIKLCRMSKGLSSKLYIVANSHYDYDSNKYIFRIFNPDVINKESAEVQYLFSNKLKIGPRLVKQLAFGQIEEFLDCHRSKRRDDLYKNISIYQHVAKYLAAIHHSKLNNVIDYKHKDKNERDGGWINKILESAAKYAEDDNNNKWLNDIIQKYDKTNNLKSFIQSERKWLQEMIHKNNYDICYTSDEQKEEKKFAGTIDNVFSHNDLNHRNILLQTKFQIWSNRMEIASMEKYLIMRSSGVADKLIKEEMNKDKLLEYWQDSFLNKDKTETQKYKDLVKIIDYEYSGYCNRFWDFAHYFCELTISLKDKCEIKFDEEYPDKMYRKSFVRFYLYQLLKIKLKNKENNLKINEKYIDQFVECIEFGALYVHLTCIFWAVEEHAKNNQNGFDFKDYAIQRMHCYFKHKKKLKVLKIGINGFGRIGRMVLRASLLRDDIEVVAINDPFIKPEYMVYMFKYDSAQGRLDGDVETDGKNLIIQGKTIHISAERDPSLIAWKGEGVDYVAECSGIFKEIDSASAHLSGKGGAKKVIISAPSGTAPMFCMNINTNTLNGESLIVSNASCTTNCLAPIVKVLNDSFGIEHGLMTTVHAATATQACVDSPNKKDWRIGRAAYNNIIPASTGAAKAIGKVIPDLNGKLNGMCFRVPVECGSVVDLTAKLKKDTNYKEVCDAINKASKTTLKGILGYCNEKITSKDIIGDARSSIVDGQAGMMMGKRLVKIVAWYDNEWGYSCRLLDLCRLVAVKDGLL